MRILVTGHYGYIGSVMAPMLAEAGHEVIGLDAFWFADQCTFTRSQNGASPAVPAIHKDVRDITESDLDGFDAIVHLAGLANDPMGNMNPEWTYEINHRASVRLAEMARERGVNRFVFASTCSVYGAAGDDFLTEDSPAQPVTPYAESKVRVEDDVSKLADSDFTPVFMRNATAYGVSPRLRMDLVLNNLVGSGVTTGRVLIMSDGTPWRPLVHIRDISTGVLAALEAPAAAVRNRIFNVGKNGENYQVSELAEMVQDIVPDCVIEYAEGGGPDPRCYRVDCTRYETTFPNRPLLWTAREGVKELYEAYRAYGLTVSDMSGPRFVRLGMLERMLGEGVLNNLLRSRVAA